jgi:hypothetical protein
MTTIQNNFQARVQLQNFHHLPVEILRGDSNKSEPFQLPCDFLASSQPFSATKQAFLDMASAPLLNLDDLDESFNFNDSDPEILLSDSDEEDDELIAMGGCDELECDTAIDSEDMNNLSEGSDDMEDFDELVDRNSINSSFSVLSFNSANEQSADARPRRVFIDLPESQQ